MSNPPPFLRRHLPCTLTAEVLPFHDPGIMRVDYRLVLPSFGFDLTAQALLSAEVVNRSNDRENLLLAIGRDAMTRALRLLLTNSAPSLPHSPLAPFVPAPAPSSQERRPTFDSDLPQRLPFSTADKEILRGFRISPE